MTISYVGDRTGAGTGAVTLNTLTDIAISGDLEIVFVERSFNDTDQTAPTGWTEFPWSPLSFSDNFSSRLQAFWRIADGTSTDNITIEDGGNHQAVLAQVFRGTRLVDPFKFQNTGVDTSQTTSAVVPSGGNSTSTPYSVILNVLFTGRDSVSNSVNSGTWLNNDLKYLLDDKEAVVSNAGDGGCVAAYWGWKKDPGTISDTTVTLVTSMAYGHIMLALEPKIEIEALPANPYNDILQPEGYDLIYYLDNIRSEWRSIFNGTVSIAPDVITGPFGGTCGDRISTANANSPVNWRSYAGIPQGVLGTFSANTDYTFSTFAKAGPDYSKVGLSLGTDYVQNQTTRLTYWGTVIFDLANVTTGTSSGGGVTISNIVIKPVGTDGWYYCQFTYSQPGSGDIWPSAFIAADLTDEAAGGGNPTSSSWTGNSPVYFYRIALETTTPSSVYAPSAHPVNLVGNDATITVAVPPTYTILGETAQPPNRIIAPNDFSDASWTTTNATVTTDTTTAPDSSATADTLAPTTQGTPTATRPSIKLTNPVSALVGDTVEFSAWVKAGGSGRFGLAVNESFYVGCDLSGSGSADSFDIWGPGEINSSSITQDGDWYLVKFNFTLLSDVSPLETYIYIPIGLSDAPYDESNLVTYGPSSTVFIWGASLVFNSASHQIRANNAALSISSGETVLTASAGSFSVAGVAASVIRDAALAASAGSFSVQGQAATLSVGRSILADSGSVQVVANDATLLADRSVLASNGSIDIVGNDAALSATRSILADSGSVDIVGNDAALPIARSILADSGSVQVVANDAALIRTVNITANAGAYSIVGQAAALTRTFTLAAEVGAFAIVGNDAFETKTRLILADLGQFIVSGQDANIVAAGNATLTAEVGAYVITGNEAGLNKTLRRRIIIIT